MHYSVREKAQLRRRKTKLTYDPEDEQVIYQLRRGAHGIFLALIVDQRVQVEQQQEREVGGAVDDELDKGRVDDLAHAGARHQKVADGEQRPKHCHAQHRGYLQTGVFAAVAGRLAEPDGVEELLTVGLSHKLERNKENSLENKCDKCVTALKLIAKISILK